MKKSVVFPIILSFLTAVGITVGVELYVRLIVDDGMRFDLEMWKYARAGKQVAENPKIAIQHVPNASFHVMGVDVDLSDQGFRDRYFELKKPVGTTRILMLGDSLTFGWGVPQEMTTSKRLERRLRADGYDVEVINTGMGNTNTVMQVTAYKAHWRKFRPDLVILNYFINDAEPVPAYSHGNFLQRHSYAYTYLKGRIDTLERMIGAQQHKDWMSYYTGLYDHGGGWADARNAIDELASICRDDGTGLMIVHYPELRTLDPYPFTAVTDRVRKTARDVGAPFLDLLPSIRDHPPESLWVTAPDPHPNATANSFFAKAMEPPVLQWIQSNTETGETKNQ